MALLGSNHTLTGGRDIASNDIVLMVKRSEKSQAWFCLCKEIGYIIYRFTPGSYLTCMALDVLYYLAESKSET